MNSLKSPISFSFLFFSDVHPDIPETDKYNFMRDLVLFADRENFEAVYFPERHFHEFGAIYPNPALLASWLIPQTSRIRFRTAGISLPLHHPAEVAESWAVNDILSDGRVDLGFGSGWHEKDFILAPNNYHARKEKLSKLIDQVQKLWRGDTVLFKGPDNKNIPIQTYPRPKQKELNVWLLVTQNDEAFRYAGAAGYNVFTMLYGYGFEELGNKIAIYRDAQKKAGLNPSQGSVSLMLHTLVLEDSLLVRQVVEAPLREYIMLSLKAHLKEKNLTEKEEKIILEYSFNRYYETATLFGSEKECHAVIEKAISIGVDEIVCLVDFGVSYDVVRGSLPILKRLILPFQKDIHADQPAQCIGE